MEQSLCQIMENCKNADGKCEPECPPEYRVPKCDRIHDYNTHGAITGIKRLTNKWYNKGLAFTIAERQFLGIHGLLPAVVKTEEEQIEHCTLLVDRLKSNLDKYMYLMSLAHRNQRLFYQLIASNVYKFQPLIYTPTVGEACLNFGIVYDYPQGLFISIKDRGHVYDMLSNWPEKDVRAIVVTDGERILGLGDLGAYGMGIPIGKMILYTVLAGINPKHCLPIMLDCGTKSNSLILDPLYIGIREQRLCGCCYDKFIDEFMHAVVRRFGRTCLIHFEDFGNENAFRLLDKYRDKFCTFNDDIQGTGAAVLSGIIVALKITKQTLASQRILFFGAGEASIGIAKLLKYAIIRSGVDEVVAKNQIWLFDTKGLVVQNRPSGGLTKEKLQFAQTGKPTEDFYEAVEAVAPTILIGAAAIPGVFTPQVLKLMAKINERPIIFALSNPTVKAECTAKDAYKHTSYKCLFASGSPFPPLTYRGKKYLTAQSNNSTVFPGIALGVISAGMTRIPDEIFFIAAETLADFVSAEEMSMGLLYPSHTKYLCVSIEIARWVMEYAYRFGLATIFPEPENKVEFLKSHMYDLNYPPIIPEVYLKGENL